MNVPVGHTAANAGRAIVGAQATEMLSTNPVRPKRVRRTGTAQPGRKVGPLLMKSGDLSRMRTLAHTRPATTPDEGASILPLRRPREQRLIMGWTPRTLPSLWRCNLFE